MDSTLVDTSLIIERIWRTWSRDKGIDFAEVSAHVHGRKIEQTLALLDPRFATSEEENKVRAIALHTMKEATAIQGARQFVEKIAAPSWGIATSGPRKIAETSLLAAGFRLPEVMVCGEDVVNGKPHPEPFALAARLLKIDTSRCVAFEDSPAGIQSAKAAGCFTVALLTSHEKSEVGMADAIIDAYSDLVIDQDGATFNLYWN